MVCGFDNYNGTVIVSTLSGSEIHRIENVRRGATLFDFNQDGYQDLIFNRATYGNTNNIISQTCSISLGDGSSFAEPIEIGNFHCYHGSRFLDFDLDGDLDIVNGQNIVFQNGGGFDVLSVGSIGGPLPDGDAGSVDFLLGDMDLDGDLDFFTLPGRSGPGGMSSSNVRLNFWYNPSDPDGDGIFSEYGDACPNSPEDALVDGNGCAANELDSDNDGVTNDLDQCPNTSVLPVNDEGCALSELDTDEDGISDAIDQCVDTPPGSSVNLNGCAIAEADTDGDGVMDVSDNCPETESGDAVDANGCADDDVVDLDGDSDGVRDSVDQCPNTTSGSIVDANGCEIVLWTPPPDNSGSNSNEESDSQGESDGGADWFMCCSIIFIIGMLGAIGATQYESGSNQFAVNVQQHTPVNVQQTVVVQPQPTYQPAPVPIQTAPPVVQSKSGQEFVAGEAVSQHGDAITGTKNVDQSSSTFEAVSGEAVSQHGDAITGGGTKIINDADAIAKAAIDAYRMGQSDAKNQANLRCNHCQAPIEAGWKFCPSCKKPLA